MSGLLALALLSGYGPYADNTGWRDQQEPSGPCYRVNLLDGLDETSTDELQDTYTCLNREGLLQPFGGVVEALEQPGRGLEPAGIDAARAVNNLARSSVDVFGLAGRAWELLEDPDGAGWQLLRASMEMLYGASWDDLRNGQVSLRAGSALEQGAVYPLLRPLSRASSVLLDDDLQGLDALADALESPHTVELAWTLAALAEHPTHGATLSRSPRRLGVLLGRTRSPGNDRWSEATGDSLRDLTDRLIGETRGDGRLPLEHLADPLALMLEDSRFRDRMRQALQQLSAQDRLAPLPDQALYLTRVRADGGDVARGQDSALISLLRLLHRTNAPMRCTMDVIITDIELDLGNLAVLLVDTLAQQDPGAVEGGVTLLGAVVGWGLTQDVLYWVADTGACPLVDDTLVGDLQSIDRLNDPETDGLLSSVIELLAAVYDPQDSRAQELVDQVSVLYTAQAVRPLEELLRDVLPAQLVTDLVGLAPTLLEPGALDGTTPPDGYELLNFDTLWELGRAALSEDDQGQVPLFQLVPPGRALFQQDDTWTALHNLGDLLQLQDARVSQLPSLTTELLQVDPELNSLRDLAPLLRDPAIVGPTLRVAENPAVLEALTAAELSVEGPLPFMARLVVGDTLPALLAWVDWSLTQLNAEG